MLLIFDLARLEVLLLFKFIIHFESLFYFNFLILIIPTTVDVAQPILVGEQLIYYS